MKTMRFAAALLAPTIALGAGRPLAGQHIVTLDSPSPLLEIRILVKAGSTADPAGREGLAALTARGLLQGGFGSAANPVTKEKLAEMTRPWASRAQPSVVPEKKTTTFGMSVPLEVAMPGADAAGLHAGHPIAITREHPDFWPLYVANVYFGTHRDSHGLLYQQIRNLRGYNYGAYSYIEHFSARPGFLFPPFNTPRRHQYFSIWIRPVSAEHTPHLLKALTWELENLVRNGVPPQDVALSKNKARTLYLNLAENTSRLLAARMDDAFYGMSPGYLDAYLERIDAVTPAQVNAALRKHLRYRDLKYMVVTDREKADALAAAIQTDAPQWGKAPQDYQIEVERSAAGELYRVPADKLEILRRDAVWAHHPLALDPARVHVLPVEALFETGAVPRAGAMERPGAQDTTRR